MSIRPYRQILRRKCRQIMVGKVPVGGDAPITVQTMTNTLTSDVDATVAQIRAAEAAGADIVRVSCPDEESTAGLAKIVPQVGVPIVEPNPRLRGVAGVAVVAVPDEEWPNRVVERVWPGSRKPACLEQSERGQKGSEPDPQPVGEGGQKVTASAQSRRHRSAPGEGDLPILATP
jgi:hypothetical protein